MVGRLIEQQQLGRIASPEHAGRGRFQAFAAAERRQRQVDLIGAQLQLRQTGPQQPLIQRSIFQLRCVITDNDRSSCVRC